WNRIHTLFFQKMCTCTYARYSVNTYQGGVIRPASSGCNRSRRLNGRSDRIQSWSGSKHPPIRDSMSLTLPQCPELPTWRTLLCSWTTQLQHPFFSGRWTSVPMLYCTRPRNIAEDTVTYKGAA